MKSFKILLFNISYCLGFDGSIWQYVLHFYRYFFCSKKIQRRVLNELALLMKKTNPDLCCLIEIESHQLEKHGYSFYDAATKYGKKSILPLIPFFKGKCNGFLSKKNIPFQKHYLTRGGKKLVYELFLPGNLSVFLVHLSLSSKMRKKQFEELGHFVHNKKVIICGDFNIWKGIRELDDFLRMHDLKMMGYPTFPAHRPKKILDVFVYSRNLDVKKITVFKEVKISDHLPVLLKISL
ncbi:hypothetical protein HYW83_02640 [Candidatus Peregrinibacteria bacterium]|nr:hypothetical protein [Candidatus Peregrinibacteria bacterium]